MNVRPSAVLREAIAETTVEILGEHADMMAIFTILDNFSKEKNKIMTRGYTVEVKGTYIKVIGDAPEVGVFLREINQGFDYQFPLENIALNDPSRLMLLIPQDIPDGQYELHIVTQYSKGNKPLKEARSATFSILQVV